MGRPTKQARATARRKERQREQRCVDDLRERALGFEGMNARGIVRMSPEALERAVASGKRRRMVTHFDGIALALAAASISTLRAKN